MKDRAAIILGERDPYVREVWAAGYDYYYRDYPMDEMVLVNEREKLVKRIRMTDLAYCICRCDIMSGINRFTGKIHRWIREADGSADRFRKLIAPETVPVVIS